MNRIGRLLLLFAGCGVVWYYAMRFFFVITGAQNILADPARQSSKFIKNFTEYEPLPRMAADNMMVLKGLMIAGVLVALVFTFLNAKLKGHWIKRGLVFGCMHWALMTPWFEFYLPYNVMHEPLPLVLLEAVLWLGTTLTIGLFLSLVMNFRTANDIRKRYAP